MKYNMNIREKFSTGLLFMGLIIAFLPYSGSLSLIVKPTKLMPEILDEKTYFTVDQVARFIVSEDTSIQIVDLRSPEEFRSLNIPGSINIPYFELLNNDPGNYLNNANIKYIFYSNGDLNSNYSLVIAKGLNYKNIYVMKGGLNEWFSKVMNSNFTGDRISARENAVFENRIRARKIFTEINNLPDSMKLKFIRSDKTAVKKLDGGCE
jgi:rhodanese-related sulfurtransferase